MHPSAWGPSNFICRARRMGACTHAFLALAFTASTALVADAGLQGIDFFVDVVEPLPGQLVQHGAPVKLVADVTASRAFAPDSSSSDPANQK